MLAFATSRFVLQCTQIFDQQGGHDKNPKPANKGARSQFFPYTFYLNGPIHKWLDCLARRTGPGKIL